MENAMRKKAHKQQRKLSTDTLLKTSKKKDIELTEEELGKVSAGVDIKGSVEYKDWIDVHSFQWGVGKG
jgi:NOL1/NOP2/fmu family ribosome biogenesis protein